VLSALRNCSFSMRALAPGVFPMSFSAAFHFRPIGFSNVRPPPRPKPIRFTLRLQASRHGRTLPPRAHRAQPPPNVILRKGILRSRRTPNEGPMHFHSRPIVRRGTTSRIDPFSAAAPFRGGIVIARHVSAGSTINPTPRAHRAPLPRPCARVAQCFSLLLQRGIFPLTEGD
jgi:hypothetical protein